VTAKGLVFFADRNGLVQALDAAAGHLRWKAYTGGAVFFPPAVWKGRLYVGSADGRVYAFEAATGRMLWQFRIAPAERRIPVFGKLVSTWPVAGGVVVADGVVYAAAGITHYDGTYVCALDAVSGKVKWLNDTSGRLSAKTDGGISLQGALYLAEGELRFAGGNLYGVARYDLGTGKCLNKPHNLPGSDFHTAFYSYYPRFGRYLSLDHTLPDGTTLSYEASYDGVRHASLALLSAMPAGAPRPEGGWRLKRRRQDPVRRKSLWEKNGWRCQGFVIAPDALLVAGETVAADQKSFSLAAVNVKSGADLWRRRLPAPVVKGGIAVDHKGRIFLALEDGRILAFGRD